MAKSEMFGKGLGVRRNGLGTNAILVHATLYGGIPAGPKAFNATLLLAVGAMRSEATAQ